MVIKGGDNLPDRNDWRLTNQMNYLYTAQLIKLDYFTKCKEWDHDHCEFCWVKFNSDKKNGYCTIHNDHWICENCFGDFKDLFKWKTLNL